MRPTWAHGEGKSRLYDSLWADTDKTFSTVPTGIAFPQQGKALKGDKKEAAEKECATRMQELGTARMPAPQDLPPVLMEFSFDAETGGARVERLGELAGVT